MSRPELIKNLKELRKKGVDLGIKLTAPTHHLQIVYDQLIKQQLKQSRIRSSRNVDSFANIYSPLLLLILKKLSINTIYRMYLFSEVIRKEVNKDEFWKMLIVRDYGLLPKFPIDPKLHYLRIDKFKIAGDIWVWNKYKSGHIDIYPNHAVHGFNRSIKLNEIIYISPQLSFNTIYLVDRHQKIYHDQSDKGEYILPRGEQVKNIFNGLGGRPHILTYSGKIFGLYEGSLIEMPNKGVGKIVQADGSLTPGDIYLLNRMGEVYYTDTYGKILKIDIPEKVIIIDGDNMLGESGNIYYFNSMYNRIINTGRGQYISQLQIIRMDGVWSTGGLHHYDINYQIVDMIDSGIAINNDMALVGAADKVVIGDLILESNKAYSLFGVILQVIIGYSVQYLRVIE